ncbi:amidophosphoribosyltransferase [Edaphocola aurantiacus]|uniref:amidophosphoribosyltransferase n=1 Tax=Edaphocola aurantiacus TaxID=2601682 RepID=UPI001FE38F34|nr:amidophosphoribosyltransferase [Edaphocola aurantiacus]
MEKQHNRGQDGAGIATLKLNVEPGYQYMHRLRVSGPGAIKEIFNQVNNEVEELEKMYPDLKTHPGMLKGYLRFMGETMLGHLRYGTQGRNNVAFCHPFVKPDINPARNLTMAGNFNLVNTDELYNALDSHPTQEERTSDLGAMIETVHHYLCQEEALSPENPNIARVLQQATSKFDGGFVCGGLVGNGSSFVMRDKNGIRPAYYYQDDEVIVVASERPAIQTTFNLQIEDIKELEPGHAVIVDADGTFNNVRILEESPKTACSFERIYFSRGSDADIYKERIALGEALSADVLKAINHDLKNTIVSFIPNTAEIAFYGLIKGLETWLKDVEVERIIKNKDTMSDDEIRELIHRRVRIEKIAIKDVKLRTFITEDSSRDEMVQHVYDITYGTVKQGVDTLVVIDDSIVRGTTLRQSIITMLDRLKPKRIIIVSSAPQIRYPDCYGIDMSRMGDFIAFQAAVDLLKDQGRESVMQEVYDLIKNATDEQLMEENYVQRIYADFTDQQVSDKIAELLKPEHVTAQVNIIYQTVDGLHKSCPNNTGDWYFTGNYPTKGGNRVANKAFMNYMERKTGRGY